jgi:hypothetical protein
VPWALGLIASLGVQERKSMLGLDKLAAQKRAENMAKRREEEEADAEGRGGWEGDGEEKSKKNVQVSDRAQIFEIDGS